ncbi:MAG TPA: hypothetical protein DIT67_13190 [Octadecabacter sp.]|nr:hypothetical protein [Octadecabacter sp.]
MLNNIGLPGVILLLLVLLLFYAPIHMARKRNRSGLLWFAIGFLGTPLLAILILIGIGDKPRSQTATSQV